MPSKTKPLPIELLETDAGTQSRLAPNEEVILDYMELIEASGTEWPFPPVVVFHDGSRYMVADGFHRVLGATKTKRASIPCTVHKGTATDARIFAMTANDSHGLRMTRADKRSCVEWLLDNSKMTQTEASVAAGVTARTVRRIVAERKEANRTLSAPPMGGEVNSGEDGRTDSDGTEPTEETAHQPAEDGTESAGEDVGAENDEWDDVEESIPAQKPPAKVGEKCPNCLGTKWRDGACVKCSQPEGEPAGEVDEDRIGIQRSKTRKTIEALMRAFDDLQMLSPNTLHKGAIDQCKGLMADLEDWK